MSKKISVVGIGEALWDMLPEGKKLGGAPANFAYHVAQFGIPSQAISAVGNDQLGQSIIEQLDLRHMHHLIETVPYPTGTVHVTLDHRGVPCYRIKEGTAWDNIPFTSRIEEAAKACTAVCFGSLAQRSSVSRQTIYRFLESMPNDDDHLRIFDINLRQDYYSKEVIDESFSRCNILKINDEELSIVAHLFGLCASNQREQSMNLLHRYSLRMVILTCGAEGSYVFTPSQVSYFDTPKVRVADTVGAGDSFTAAFAASLLRGRSLQQSHELAVKVSAYVCTQNGAMPTLPKHLRLMG